MAVPTVYRRPPSRLLAMAHELGIVDLLRGYGYDPQLKAKLVRHQDARFDVPALIRDGWFDLYQQLQKKPIFDGCNQLVSFVGDGPGRARFVGVYPVLGQRAASKADAPAGCPFPEWAEISTITPSPKKKPARSVARTRRRQQSVGVVLFQFQEL